MKHLVALSCLALSLVAVPTTANAQNVSLGLKFGVNAVTLHGSNISGQSSYARMIAGGFVTVDLSRYFAFQPELLYAQKGTKYVDSDEDMRTKIDYVEIPLLARLHLPNAATVRPYALVGPTVAFNTTCRFTGTNENHAVDTKCEGLDAIFAVKNTDYGLAFGAGAEMRVRRAFVGLDARYQLGLSDIYANRATDVKHRAFAVMLGARFPLGAADRLAVR